MAFGGIARDAFRQSCSLECTSQTILANYTLATNSNACCLDFSTVYLRRAAFSYTSTDSHSLGCSSHAFDAGMSSNRDMGEWEGMEESEGVVLKRRREGMGEQEGPRESRRRDGRGEWMTGSEGIRAMGRGGADGEGEGGWNKVKRGSNNVA